MDDQQYQRYQEVRNRAWQCLIENDFSSMPIKVSLIAQNLGVSVMTYEEASDLITQCGFTSHAADNEAFSVYTDQWYVLYDDALRDESRIRFVIMHELAHIMLEHKTERQKVGYFTAYYTLYNKNEPSMQAIEQEASMFASRVLAPAFVLSLIGIHEPEEMAEFCGLPIWEAKERSQRIKKLIEKDSFFKHRLEKKVYKQFQQYIEDYINSKNNV